MHTAANASTPLDHWPIYFAARDIEARNFQVKRGDLFPVQRKGSVKDYLRGFVPNIDSMPVSKIPLLKTLLVPPRVYSEIISSNATYETALAILKRRTRG
jgi:hypothetical protein